MWLMSRRIYPLSLASTYLMPLAAPELPEYWGTPVYLDVFIEQVL